MPFVEPDPAAYQNMSAEGAAANALLVAGMSNLKACDQSRGALLEIQFEMIKRWIDLGVPSSAIIPLLAWGYNMGAALEPHRHP